MADNIVQVTSETFQDEVLDADMPVLIDFWAVWCGPCKMIAPIVEDLANEYEGKLKVGKLDADTNQDVLMNYGIMGIPTLILFNNGEPAVRITGYRPKEMILKELKPYLG